MKFNFIYKSVFFVFSLIIIAFTYSCSKDNNTDKTSKLKIWYKQPARATEKGKPYKWDNDKEWLKALPLGNGSLGAMVFGDVNKERIQLNEESMWSGSITDNNNPKSYPAQTEIRRLLFAGKYKEANKLINKTQICKGKGTGPAGAEVPYGSHQTLGDLWLDFDNKHEFSNYERELDLDDAIARVSYIQDGVKYNREIFVSKPEQAMVIKLTADKPGKISFTTTLSRPERFQIKTEKNQLIMFGTLSDGKNGDGLKYMTRLTAKNKNGNIEYTENSIVVKNADEITLLLTASTDYIFKSLTHKGRKFVKITNENLEKAKKLSFETIKTKHLKEYQNYYKRVYFDISGNIQDTIPTDIRLEKYKRDQSDKHLIELLFQYGRYLLISSSRPGTMPANLQGIWNNKIQAPWNADYHTDVNIQMNYWLAETTNLGEMHLPLVDLMNTLVEPGKKTAKIHYNAKGWVVHPVTNAWGYTAPGEDASWGMHVGGGAWITTHIMEHYYFTLDKEFLKRAFPILELSTQFYMDWLITDPKTGELISGPSVSPENTFRAPDGSASQVCMGPAHDQEVIWQLFKNYIDASKAIGNNSDFLHKVIKAQQQLTKPKIAKDGRLMEWNEEFKELEPGHRHISHLFALHPGYQIDMYKTPKLAEAARKSLDYRVSHGGGWTGWSAAWLVNQYARLENGEKALTEINTVLTKTISTNLFGQHPPFQIDANFGVTAGIAEMLLQSQSEEIRILPALPKYWNKGSVKGLCARGGFVLDFSWNNTELNSVKIYSKNGGICKVWYNGMLFDFSTEKGKDYTLKVENGIISH